MLDLQDALFDAVSAGDAAAVIEALSTPGIDPNVMDEELGTPLSRAVVRPGGADVVRVLLQHGAYVDEPTHQGEAPLAIAAREGLASIVRFLASAGADVNRMNQAQVREPCHMGGAPRTRGVCEDRPGTALMQAAHRSHVDVVRLLVRDLGADAHAADLGGNTALSWAARNGDVATSRVLLEEGGADVNWQDNGGSTALIWAAHRSHRELVRYLGGRPLVDVNAADAVHGRTALMWAVARGNFDAAEELLEAGADVHAKDLRGQTALTLAIALHHLPLRNLLYEAGATVMLGEQAVSLELLIALGHFQAMGDAVRRTVFGGGANATGGASLAADEDEDGDDHGGGGGGDDNRAGPSSALFVAATTHGNLQSSTK
eukprot:g1219.t1